MMHQVNTTFEKYRQLIKTAFIALFTCAALTSYSTIRVPNIIGSNMVLQQKSDVKLWGWGEPNEKVVIITSWDNKTYPTVTVTGNATWELTIKTPVAGGPYIIKLNGSNSIVLTNVLIGEVWVCSGQSNMEMSGTWGLQDIKAELPKAKNNNIRFFHMAKASAPYPQQDCIGEWVICDSASLRTFSATGYFFGKNLNSKLNLPVGLIQSCWSGSSADVWTPDSIINNDPILKEATKKIAVNGQVPNIAGYVYNAMIAPITNYAVAGVIWYQGENNSHVASIYQRLFTSMIDAWRGAFHKNLPFYFVQVAPFKYQQKNWGALIREAQTASMKHPNTGMVITTDLTSDTNNVHPADKHDVGLRLANWALAETYHQPGIVYKSPLYASLSIKKDKAIITVDNAEHGLTINGKQATQLYIAGSDKIFYPANARLKNNQMIVWSDKVKEPVAVRYEFSNTAIGNIFSKDGLPLGPFRTDSWPVENEYKFNTN
ncbi:sialate O-acetylesterase [Mucilaginibacter boryungensis]|nr:sialate O-acetylesterase [Mucilaginibacter boryungensis]